MRVLVAILAGMAVCAAQDITIREGVIRASGRGELTVYVDGVAGGPPVLGRSRPQGADTVFEPRFPLQPGVRYRVVFRGPRGEQSAVLETSRPEEHPAARVLGLYPSAPVWPENELKFYIHFSRPMSRAEVYRRVTLLEEGRPVDLPFLELDQELWDPEGKRVTILFDPGRIKRDLKPHREAGSPLQEGKRYTLVVDRGWPDASGRPLAGEFRKDFQAGPPDREPVDPKRWIIRPPPAATLEPLVVEFGEPLDRALAERVIRVADQRGALLDGDVELTRQETCWRFTPRRPWNSGRYWLRVEKILEDLAGNTVGKPFEVDVFEKVEERLAGEFESVEFAVQAAPAR